MKQRQLVAWSGLILAATLGVGIILLLTSSPSHRTVTIAPAAAKRTTKVDPAAAKAAFDAQVAEYKAAGEPVQPADLASPPLAPEKNAAPVLVQAIAILDMFDEPPNQTFFNIDVKLTMPASQWKRVDDVLSGPLAPMLAKVDEATALPACVWDIKYTSPVFRTLLPHLNGMRGTADIVRSAALSAHRSGRDDEALRRITQLLQMARFVDQSPFVVTHLVALGISHIGTQTAGLIVPTLKIGDSAGAASEAQVKALIADLLDETWAREGLRSALLAERLSLIDTATCLETGKVTAAEMAKLISARQTFPSGEPARVTRTSTCCR